MGGVLSSLTMTLVGLLTLPAWSVHVPFTWKPEVSDLNRTSCVHSATPVEMCPGSPFEVKLTVVSVLFHPAALGAGFTCAAGELGGVVSGRVALHISTNGAMLPGRHAAE